MGPEQVPVGIPVPVAAAAVVVRGGGRLEGGPAGRDASGEAGTGPGGTVELGGLEEEEPEGSCTTGL